MSMAIQSAQPRSKSRPGRSVEAARRDEQYSTMAGEFPVLIRLPNLENPPAANRSNRSSRSVKDETQVADNPADELQVGQEESLDSTSTPLRSTQPAPTMAQQIIGWAWKAVVLVAAIGLLVLAYRIINGPGEKTAPTDATPTAPVDTTGSELPALGENNLPPIQRVQPRNDGFQEPAPSQPSLPAGTDHPAVIPTQPYPNPTAPSTTGEGVPLPPTDAALPIGATDANWDGPHDNNYGDESTRSWGDTASEQVNPSRPWATGGTGAAAAEPGDWQNGSPYPTTQTPSGSYDYPETKPTTWRDAGSWNSQEQDRRSYHQSGQTYPQTGQSYPQTGPQQSRDAAPLPREWMDSGYNATRPAYPGTARLNGGIEQPPLRRDDERNGSRLY